MISLAEWTGWQRDHARHALEVAGTIKLVTPRPPRPAKYPEHLSVALVFVWSLSRYHHIAEGLLALQGSSQQVRLSFNFHLSTVVPRV